MLKIRAHPAISHCKLLLLKMKSGYINKSLAKSTLLKNYIFVKKCNLISFWMFQTCSIAFIIPSHLIIVPNLTLWMLPSGCQTVWIQIRPDILSGLIWVQTVCRGYQQTTKVTASGQRIRYRTAF